MLTTLRIKNLALVDDLTLELQPGYNVITGETGAGKSILIGALNLVLGERADRNLIRSGCETCTVEAVFDVKPMQTELGRWLEENGMEPCEEGRLLLKRSLSTTGVNRQFVNGSATNLATLSTLGDRLVDIHGPHDHQSLLHPARQLEILDAFGTLDSRRAAFADLVRQHTALVAQQTSLTEDVDTRNRRLELLRHQVREIADARLQPDEENDLQHDHQRASNAARLLELCHAAIHQLNEDENSLCNRAGNLGRVLLELERLDPETAPIAAVHQQMVTLLHDLQRALARYIDRVDLDPDRLAQLEERLNLVQSLKRKYGPTLADVLAFGDHARQQLDSLEGREARLEQLDQERRNIEAELRRRGHDLHARRRKLLPGIHHAVMKQLADLGFDRSHFQVVFTSTPSDLQDTHLPAPGPAGFDAVEFQFAPNPGEPARPLHAIASSGELARVMLALKTVLAIQDRIPVLVFDEVDANVGGETGHAIGHKMREIGRHRQVLCITHLAPVAACANAHFLVAKATKDDRTVTDLRPVAGPDRVNELARMLGGRGAVARQHAQVLLESASNAHPARG